MIPIFKTRDELLPYLINTYNLKMGLELGVRDGCFSKYLLDRTHDGFTLTGVDIVLTYALQDFLQKKHPRYMCVFEYSENVAKQVDDGIIDLVHIDAGHTYEDVKKDLNAWWPKVKPGGFFTGDDYCICNTPNEGDYGIVQAFEEWVEENNIRDVYLTQIGYASKEARLKLAEFRGSQVEDNLKKMYEPFRPHHENAYVPTWVVVKN